MSFDSIVVRVEKFEGMISGYQLSGKTSLQATALKKGASWDISIGASVGEGPKRYHVQGALSLVSRDNQWFGPYEGSARIDLLLEKGKSVCSLSSSSLGTLGFGINCAENFGREDAL